MKENQSYIAALELYCYTDSFRSIFDNYSTEYQLSSNEIRVKKLKKILSSGINLEEVLKGYVEHYNSEKPHVSKNFVPTSITFINKHLLEKNNPNKHYSFNFIAAKLIQIVFLKIY